MKHPMVAGDPASESSVSASRDKVPLGDRVRALTRDVPDFPKPGILFKDLTPVLADGALQRALCLALAERYARRKPDLIVGIESRGFIFGAPLAVELGVGFVPVRKPGKLPWRTRRQSYALEYGTDVLEVHEDAIPAGARVVIVDDLLATGGTMGATCDLVRALGGDVVEATVIVELGSLGGRARLEGFDCFSVVSF